jgi:two-component system cell cycle sensor histidine kinase/response regulator CckA
MNEHGAPLESFALIDLIPDSAWLKDLTGRYVLVNASFAAAVNRPKDEVIGRRDEDLFPPDVAARFRRRDDQAIARGEPVVTEELIGVGDAARWFETIARTVSDADAIVIGTSGVARDVTSRKEAEAALRASEAQLRAVFEESPLGISLTNADGFIVHSNARYQRMVGYSADELRHMKFSELSPIAEASENSVLFRDLMAGRRASYIIEKVYRRKSGETLSVRVTAAPVRDDRGRVAYAVGMVEDVTEMRETEAVLRDRDEQFLQAQKMESIGRLAGGVAHDFNNLLTVIIAHAEFLRADGTDPAEWREDVDQIADAALRASTLTRQLLAFGRKQLLQPRAVNLNEIVENLVPMLRRSLGEDVRLRTSLTDDLPPVHADPGQIEQVLLNLAANARDAMPGAGTLVLSTRLATATDGPAVAATAEICIVPRVVLSMSDTGVGMDAIVAGRAFEPFFTTKEPGRGTGLGLSTVYGIVRQSGGTITLDTHVGEGTTFTICLPVDHEQAGAIDELGGVRPAATEGGDIILLVEDERAVRRLATRILSRHGYRVIEASCGADALQFATESPGAIGLLLTDVVMPEMSGSELAAAMRGLQPDIDVLYMSGYTDDEVFQRGLLPRGMSFLPKPFTGSALLAAVRRQLDRVGV